MSSYVFRRRPNRYMEIGKRYRSAHCAGKMSQLHRIRGPRVWRHVRTQPFGAGGSARTSIESQRRHALLARSSLPRSDAVPYPLGSLHRDCCTILNLLTFI